MVKEYDTPVLVELSEEAAEAIKENMFKERNELTNEKFKKEFYAKADRKSLQDS